MTKNQPLKIIFVGTPKFGADILEGLIKNYKPVLVITEPDKPTGRKQTLTPPPVKVLAEKHNISVLQPEKIRNLELEIRNLSPDIIITASYGQILPKEILDIPEYGCLNVHPSLLPKYRGPSPIQYAILNGDKKTGVTIMLTEEKIDSGPTIVQEEIDIEANDNNETLHQKTAELAVSLLSKIIPKWIEGKIKPKPQDESKAAYTKILTREDGKIDWSKSADEIGRQIRAFYPWPGAFTLLKIKNQKSKIKNTNQNPKLLKIIEARFLLLQTKKQIGETFLTDDELAVQTGQNCLILQKLQLEGKKPTSGRDFLHGHPDFVGAILK